MIKEVQYEVDHTIKAQCHGNGRTCSAHHRARSTGPGLSEEGNCDFTACLSGTARSNPPGGMMDNATFRCVGMRASLGGKNSQNTLCEAVDGDGDKQRAYVFLGPDGRVTRDVLSGTGKHQGLQMSCTVTPLGKFPTIKLGTFQNCNQQTGMYKMK
jgi:hypothetical protein